MNFISSTAARGFSTSAWQTLERAATKRLSAATVLKLLTKMMQPAAATAPQASRLPVLAPVDAAIPHVTDVPFERWAALADAYAEQFLRMQRGDKGARERALGLSNEMLRMNQSMK